MAPTPQAHGNLTKTPLAHLILQLAGKKLSGTLAIWRPDGAQGQDRIRFADGVPVAAAVETPGSSLDRSLLPLFERTGVPYAFYAEDLVPDANVEGETDPLRLIAASCRGVLRDDVVDPILARLKGLLRLRRGAPMERLGLIAKETAFVDLIRAKPQSVERLIDVAPNARVARRMLYLLAITRCVEAIDPATLKQAAQKRANSKPPAARISRPPVEETSEEFDLPGLSEPPPAPESAEGEFPAPPASLSEEHRERWLEIVEFAKRVDTMNYFEMLGVEQTVSPKDVQPAFFQLVKKWHPDRLPTELEPLRETADTIFGHLSDAEKTLTDLEERGKYLKSVQGGGGTPEADRRLAAVLSAALDFQKVEVLERRRRFDEALTLLHQVLEVSDDDPDYHAMHGLLLFRQSPTDKKIQQEALLLADKALGMDEKNERAKMLKAELLSRRGRDEEAIELYREVAAKNPKNEAAARQVRLANMRGGSGKKKSKSGDEGLLGKLFGKKK